jgi:hypothetical protein
MICRPEDWFHSGKQAMEFDEPPVSRTWVWDFPPAAALHAIEVLSVGRLKRHNVLRGVVIVPSIMKPMWFRRFVCSVDCYFTVPAGCDAWPTNMHELL